LDHWETKDDERVFGGYGVKDPDGSARTVHYEVEGDSGFKATIKTVMPHAFHYQKLWNNQPKIPFQHAQPVSVL
jgi:Insect cuticle protein